MANKTLPTLTATTEPAADSLILIRRNGQVEDEKVTGGTLLTFFNTNVTITGSTIDSSVIGGSSAAAGTFTTLTADTIDTGNGVVECYAMDQAVRTSDSVSFSSLDLTTDLAVMHGGTGSSTASGARTNLGLGSAAVQNDTYFLQAGNNLSDLGLTSTARTNLGLGSLAVKDTINNDDWSGADLSVANGGTGASNASDARNNLGLTIGTNVQAQNTALQAIAGLTTAADRMLYTTASNVYAVATLTSFGRSLVDDASASAARTTLGLGTIATQASSNVSITGGSVTGITDITITDGGTGASTAGGARTNLGLGSIATQDATNVSISGGSITGIADIAIADGGTGASTSPGARTNLGVYSTSEVDAKTALFQANFLHLQDQKAAGTDGGAFNSGAWRTRDLNTEITDEIGSTLSSNQFTLPAGTYYIDAFAPGHGVGYHKAKLRNITDSSDVIIGGTVRSRGATESGSTVTNHSFISGRFTIVGTKTFEIQHICDTTYSEGFGRGNSFSVIEVYTDVKIWKVA